MLSARRLEILHAVLAAGSVNAAARNLNYSPATISQHLAALARETGLVLFEKEGRGIVPTDAALHLAEQAQSILADFARLERTVADLRAGQGEHLALACFASAAEELIPEVVRAVRELRPNITTEVSLNEPVDGRGRRRPDLDIRTEPVDGAEIRLEGYRRHELLTEELLAVLPAAHPLAGAHTPSRWASCAPSRGSTTTSTTARPGRSSWAPAPRPGSRRATSPGSTTTTPRSAWCGPASASPSCPGWRCPIRPARWWPYR